MRLLRGLALFVAAMFLQWCWNAHLAYWGAAPQFLLALTILVAARRGPLAAILIGWAWGLYADVLRADLFGANALLYALAGYAAGMLRRQVDLRAVGPLATAVFLMSWAYALALGVLGMIFSKGFVWIGWPSLLAGPFMNALAAVAASLIWEAGGRG